MNTSVAAPPEADPAEPRPAGHGRRLAHIPRRYPKTIMVVALLLAVAAAVFGAGVIGSLKSGGFEDPASDSVRGREALTRHFQAADPNLVIMIGKPGGGVDDPDVAAVADRVLRYTAATGGAVVLGAYWPDLRPELRSADGRDGLVLLRVDGDEDVSARRAADLRAALGQRAGPVTVRFGGLTQVNNDINEQVTKDLALAEGIAVPITLLLLVLVFGSLVAAAAPLLIGVFSILTTLGILRGVAELTDVSIFTVNLTTALGLGLAIDYSLLFVSRYRQERRRGAPDPLSATMRTAGRTILFSAAIVAAALASLLVFDQYFLRSFAYAGISVIAATVAAALLVLPALLTLLGDRIDRMALPGRLGPGSVDSPFWGKVAGWALRRPVLAAVPVLLVLAALATPLWHIGFGVPDERALPESAESHQVADRMRTGFPTTANGSLVVVAERWGDTAADRARAARYAADLSRVPGVRQVESPAGSYAAGSPVGGAVSGPPVGGDPDGGDPRYAQYVSGSAVWFSVRTDVAPYTDAGRRLAEAVRAVPVPDGGQALVTGQAAELVDIVDSIADRLPLAAALIALTTFALLFLLSGSLLIPVKALFFNVVGLGAVFGIIVWIFQDGHLAGLLGFTPSNLPVAIPVLLFCVVFGLSMDYEVFVLSRIIERRASVPLREAITEGLTSSGRVISAAAAILSVTFLSMLVSGVSFIQMLGLGAGLAILIDALIIRPVLLPALMRVAGRWNWWAPGPLRRLHARFGLREHTDA